MRVHRYTGGKPLTVRLCSTPNKVAADLLALLKAEGHIVSYRRACPSDPERLRAHARLEVSRVQQSDLVVCIRTDEVHHDCELGIALGASRPVILIHLSESKFPLYSHTMLDHHPLVRPLRYKTPQLQARIGREVLSLLEDIRETNHNG